MSNFFSSKIFVVVLVLVLAGIVIAITKESYRKYQMDKEVTGLEKEIEAIREKNESLANLLDYFNSERFSEKEARLKLNLLKEGEKLVIISSDKKPDSENQVLENIQEEQVSNFQKWWRYLFKE